MQRGTAEMALRDAPETAPAVAPLRPALFARYRDLAALRYDYPLVLVEAAGARPLLRPLMRVIDDILAETAPRGPDGEAMRQNLLRLEGLIRRRVAAGARDRLTALWRRAAEELVAASGEPRFGPLDSDLDRAREALRLDGPVIDCDAATPEAVLIHAWKAVHDDKARAFRRKVDRLILGLSDILKADHMKSHEAHLPEALETAVGTSFAGEFDFHALSRILSRSDPADRLPEERVRRIHRVLFVLRAQRFYGPGRSSERRPGQPEPHHFIFRSCAEALDAFRARLPEVLELTKAIITAELEIENRYRPELHDPILAAFDESDLTAEQLALLPPALVCLRDGQSEPGEIVQAFEALASGLPIKVLVQTDDILGDTSPEPPRARFGGGSARLAAMAVGLNDAYVLQATSAQLYRVRERLVAGMRYDGPALFSIFSGAVETVPGVAPYLLAAAATESRAFPTFSYDPAAGGDWAARFDLSGNPQPEADWPRHRLDYEDEAMQRRSEDVAFSVADFAACDRRYARYCRALERDAWDDDLVPVAEHLRLAPESAEGRRAYVLTVDPDDRLRRTVVEGRILAVAQRAAQAWRSLQELAGIDNSHVARRLAEERARWEARLAEATAAARAGEPLSAAAAAAAASAPAPDAAAVPAPPEAGASAPSPADETSGEEPEARDAPLDDGPWIETSRCTTCQECIQINDRMFAYDDNMQAYIADPDAGTFRQLVEAAEACQVAIIHPGKPRNPNEPDLEDLIARAAPFN